jgi:hypothetical protein
MQVHSGGAAASMAMTFMEMRWHPRTIVELAFMIGASTRLMHHR